MLITKEISLSDLETWSGATTTKERIMNEGKVSLFDELIEELYPNGIGETELNDLLWFEEEWLYESLGIEIEE